MSKQSLLFTSLIATSVFLFCGFSDVKLLDIQTAIIEQDYEKAQQLAAAFVATQPEKKQMLEAQYYLALSDLNLGKLVEAQDTFSQILEQQPSRNLRDRAEIGIIDSQLLQGNYDDALTRAERLAKESPKSEFMSLIIFKMGRAHFKLMQWEEANYDLKALLERFSDSPEAHLARQLMAEKHYFAVQVGSFHDQSLAEKFMQDLRKKDKYAYIVEAEDKSNKKIYRVRVGEFSRLDEAMALAKRLSQMGYPTLIYP